MVAVDAAHATALRAERDVRWEELPGFGETGSGMEAFPVTAPSTPAPAQQSCMDYDFFLYASGARTLQAILAPTLSFQPGRGLRYSVSVDREAAHVVDAWASHSDADWSRAVSDGVHRVSTALGNLAAGQHQLHFCRVDAGVVVERLLINGAKTSATYLGPPESADIAPVLKH